MNILGMKHLRILSLFLLLLAFSDQIFSGINVLIFVFKEEYGVMGDYAIAFMSYISGENKTPFIKLFNALIENRINHFKKYSWIGWIYVGLYVLYVGLTYYESKDLDDFCEKMKNQTKDLEFLLSGNKTLPKLRQKQIDVTKERNKKISDKKVVYWCCLKSGIPLLKCGGCMKARYCGQKCQEKDWCRHGDWCGKRGGRWRERKMEKRRKKKAGGRTGTSCEVD